MSIAQYLTKFALGVTPEGLLSPAKGGTGTTTGGSSGPKISSIAVTDSSYNVLDDTAVDVLGGYIKITGTGFASGCQVLVNTTAATSVTFISATEVRAQIPATAAGSYIVYVVNSDGGTAIRVNGVSFSTTPAWTTASALAGAVNAAISIQLAATSATTFALASGSTLPSGVTLSSGGLLTGTVTGINGDTTYNFTVVATDSELQDSPRTFAFTIQVGDPYFMYNSLLLSGNGTNNAQNNAFLDSSTNNFAITRNGNVAQGTFSPYGPNWSNYFDGTGDYLTTSTSQIIPTGSFTVECYVFVTGSGSNQKFVAQGTSGSAGRFSLGIEGGNWFVQLAGDLIQTGTPVRNQWNYVAVTYNGSTITLYVNGTSIGTVSSTANAQTALLTIGQDWNSYIMTGYISNVRVSNVVRTITSATAPYTSDANTRLLTCQSNRFIDTSANTFALTVNGNPSVQRFSPFSPAAAYSAGTIGGSAYFDGNGDYLTTPQNAAFNFGTGAFTVEAWVYITASNGTNARIIGLGDGANGGGPYTGWSFNINSSLTQLNFYKYDGTETNFYASYTFLTNTWYHVVTVRNGSSNLSMYINGSRVYNNASSTLSYSNVNSNPLYVGAITDGAGGGGIKYFNGYISNTRIVAGTAVYDPTVATLTVPTAPVTAISGTSLLLNYTNAGVIDNTMMNNAETVGDAKISTAQSKFGGSSMYFDGTGDYVSVPVTPNLQFGSSSFTIEAWIYPTNMGSYPMISAQYAGSAHAYFFSIGASNTKLTIYLYHDGGSSYFITTNDVTLNTWNHVALVRNGNTVTMYINGISGGNITYTESLRNITTPITVGADATGQYPFFGYIDDFRITKGYARYTANFTPPQTALLTQ